MSSNVFDVRGVSVEALRQIIETREPLGLYYAFENGGITAVDNSTGKAWTETFNDYWVCRQLLLGCFEVSDERGRDWF